MEDTKRINKTDALNVTKSNTYSIASIGIMTALLCILAPLSIPLPGGVPISLTNFVIYLCVYLIGGKKGSISYVLYLFLGTAGLPVFSGFAGGLGKLLGPTGGYLIGFLPMAIICGIALKLGKSNIFVYIVGMILGLMVAYLIGSLWFMYSCNMGMMATLKVCVIPFLIGDAIKIVAVAIVAPQIKQRISIFYKA